MNKVFLMGNLTRTPEVAFLPSGVPIAKFGIAVNRKFKGSDGQTKEDVLYMDVTAFDKKADAIGKFFEKGKAIIVEGSLRMDTWDDKTTGQKRSKTYTVLDNFHFVGGPSQPKPEPPTSGVPVSAQAGAEEVLDLGF